MPGGNPPIAWALRRDEGMVRVTARSADWRSSVSVDDLNEFSRAMESARSTQQPRREKWVNREQVAQILGLSNLVIIGWMSDVGLLNPRRARGILLFKRAEIEGVAKRYIF